MTLDSLSPAWTAAARELCNHLWQSTLFAGIVALLALLLRKNQARTRYWLWMAASAKFLVPLSLLIAIGSHLPWPHHATESTAATVLAIDEMSQPFSDGPTITPITPSVPQPVASQSPLRRLPQVLAAVWFAGVAAMTAFWCMQFRRVSKAVRSAQPLLEGREVDLLRGVEQAASLPKPIPLLSSANSMEPGVFGVIRPVLLWPNGISRHLDDAHLESVLAHEVCHVQRHDNLTSVVHMLVEAIFWFHPLVWWIEAQLVKERERACDEDVLVVCGQPKVYAESILKVCEYCVESPLPCVSGITGADLKKRVMQIMAGSVALQLDFGRKLLLLAVALASVAVPIVLGQAGASDIPRWQTAAGGRMQFDVASVKQDKVGVSPSSRPYSNFPLGSGDVYVPTGGLFVARNFTVALFISFAYKMTLSEQQTIMKQLPGWATADRYDIEAKVDGNPTKDQMRLMMQALLAERFKLTMHRETQQVPVFALVLAKPGKTGPYLLPHPAGDTSCSNAPPPPMPPPNSLTPVTLPPTNAGGFPLTCGLLEVVPSDTPGRMAVGYRNVAMPLIASQMDVFGHLDRPVIDQTGLTGNFDFLLAYTPEIPPDAIPPEDFDLTGPTFLEALPEQTGLKLVPQKGPVDLIFIDHVERPSEN